MPRRARIILPNIPQHIIQRGNNRSVCFYAEEDYCKYLEWLKEYADKAGCRMRFNASHDLDTSTTSKSSIKFLYASVISQNGIFDDDVGFPGQINYRQV